MARTDGRDTTTLQDLATPSQNSTDNNYIMDVIGNKMDTSFSNGVANPSLVGHAVAGYNHVHSPAKVYPDLADPVNVVSGAGAWNYGSWVELVPVNGITEMFDIHRVHTGEISAVDNYQLQLAKGLGGSEVAIGTIAFSRDSNQVQTASQPIQIPPQMASNRISVRLASGTGGDNCDIKVYYHEYADII